MAIILDASAILAFLLEETGQEPVAEAIGGGARVSAANLAEVLTVLVRGGMPVAEAQLVVAELPVGCIDVDLEIAQRAGAMGLVTRTAGLSLGDRLCLATAAREKRPMLTGDRLWLGVAASLGVEVRLVR